MVMMCSSYCLDLVKSQVQFLPLAIKNVKSADLFCSIY
jgi:hypothetical protein